MEYTMADNRTGTIMEYAEALFIALLLALFIRSFIVQAFTIPSPSMLETLQIGDYLLVNKFKYGLRVPFWIKETNPNENGWGKYSLVQGPELLSVSDPERGDVVVFEYPGNPSVHYIKRVIGVPGDILEIRNKVLFRNGEMVDEPYKRLDPMLSIGANFGPITVPYGKYFMLGDNRDHSNDSRFWGFVDRSAIVGKAWRFYFSINTNSFSVRWNRIGRLVHQNVE